MKNRKRVFVPITIVSSVLLILFMSLMDACSTPAENQDQIQFKSPTCATENDSDFEFRIETTKTPFSETAENSLSSTKEPVTTKNATEILGESPKWHEAEKTPSDSERDTLLSWYLSEENQCELPCFWNIKPGDKISKAANILEPIIFHHSNLSQKMTNGQFYHQHQIKIYGGIYPEKEIVFSPSFGQIVFQLYSQQAELQLAAYSFSDIILDITSEEILDELLVYDMPKIVNQYGMPDKIKVRMSYQNQVAYSIYLWYEQLHTIIVYDGLAVLSDPIELCPVIMNNTNGRIANIRFYVSTAETFHIIEDIIPELPLSNRYLKDIEQINYTKEDFYDILVNEGASSRCLKFSQNQWGN